MLKKIQLEVSKLPNVRLFRNNQGVAEYANGSRVVYGVCNPGGSDLIGWKTILVTPEMVGKKIALFAAVEVKTDKGRVSPAQVNFLKVVSEMGGVSGVARSEDDAVNLLK